MPQNPDRTTSYTIGARGAAFQARPTPRWLQETATAAVMPPGSAAATHYQKGCVKSPHATQSPTEGVARPREGCGERAERVLAESRRSTRSASERARNASAPWPSARPRYKTGPRTGAKAPSVGSEEMETWASYARTALRRTHAVWSSAPNGKVRQSAAKRARRRRQRAVRCVCARRPVWKGSSHRGERARPTHGLHAHRAQRFSGAPLSASRRLS